MATKRPHRDIHKEITNKIIIMLENGQGVADCPWYSDGSITRPTNIATGNRYNGINILALWAQSIDSGYSSGKWGTYRQWQTAGAHVKRGEKSSVIVFYKPIEHTNDAGDKERFLFARAFTVFNAEQVDGYEAPPLPGSSMAPLEAVENVVAETGATIGHGGERAYYRPSTDAIQIPDKRRFPDTESYYAVLMHELTHWTGHKSRCDRSELKSYAFEELVAELGAAFLCADLQISATPREDHAGYLASWLEALREDSKAIFRAASLASKAAEFINPTASTEDAA